MTSPWMSSPYAPPTPLIDNVMQAPAPAPIPGLLPLPLGPLGVPPFQAPFLGVPPLPVPPLGVHPAYTLGFGLQTTPWPIAGHAGQALSPVTAMLLAQLGLREAASRIGDETLKQRVITGVNEALDHTIEGLAGLGLPPWFGPGAQSMIYPVATELALIAQRYPEGDVRTALLTIAGQILHKSLTPTGEGAGRRRQ